jgi:prevent-host-death family protein
MECRLGVTQARKELGRIIDDVRNNGSTYIIVRHGQPAAAVVSMEVYRRLEREQLAPSDAIRNVQSANPEAEPDAVMRDVLDAQQAVRQSCGE